MDTKYLKNAERCERLAETCTTDLSCAFFLDAAFHWRQMALRWRELKTRLGGTRSIGEIKAGMIATSGRAGSTATERRRHWH